MQAHLSIVPSDKQAAHAAWSGVTDASIISLSIRLSIGISNEGDLDIRRDLTDATGAKFASDEILSKQVGDPETAERLLEAVRCLSPHAAVVARATMLAGVAWLDARIEATVQRLEADQLAAVEKRIAAAETADRLHRHIDVFFRGKPDTVLDLQRGDGR